MEKAKNLMSRNYKNRPAVIKFIELLDERLEKGVTKSLRTRGMDEKRIRGVVASISQARFKGTMPPTSMLQLFAFAFTPEELEEFQNEKREQLKMSRLPSLSNERLKPKRKDIPKVFAGDTLTTSNGEVVEVKKGKEVFNNCAFVKRKNGQLCVISLHDLEIDEGDV